MIKHSVLALFAVVSLTLTAQTTSTFENIDTTAFWSLTDTFWNGSNHAGGIQSGKAYFTNQYDTSFGGFWSGGFAVSSMRDSITPGFTNEYSAITASGYGGSKHYAVAYIGSPKVLLKGAAASKVIAGCYITNSTYAYRSMQHGDAFAKKFGGPTGTDPDWFLLTVHGWRGGTMIADSVNFYLADYRSPDTNFHYIIRDWSYVDLSKLCTVDSISFSLSSSDVGSFGMNTPAYFCLDNLIIQDSTSIAPIQAITKYTDTVRVSASTTVQPLTITGMVTSPMIFGATASIVGNQLVYVPAIGLIANDTIICSVCNSCGQCYNVPVTIQVKGIVATEITEIGNTVIEIYPNPTSAMIHISSHGQEIQHIILYDLSGREVLSSPFVSKDIDVSRVATGVYILQLTTTNGISTHPIVKQ